ncbi:MAG TPA: hypothetical protein PLM93_11180 [Sulfuricurvum sp.]|nr:MAG: hypothetical protein B7X89_12025 [Sulfuricurvum sp. 17-40-25]HQS67735.1 hypothetical protein [Sulfuricurvum sp.]HQT37670.1 hypothetical protein [Sulfuricurvum sp.]
MTFTDYKDKVFDSILISNLYNDDKDRELVIGALRLFMDVCGYDAFFSQYDITTKDYEKYFKKTFKKFLNNNHKIVKKILKHEEKFNESK